MAAQVTCTASLVALEMELGGQLHLPCGERCRNQSHVVICVGGACTGSKTSVRETQICMIKRIECLKSQLYRRPLRNASGLEDGHIEVEDSRPAQMRVVPWRVAEGIVCRVRKC